MEEIVNELIKLAANGTFQKVMALFLLFGIALLALVEKLVIVLGDNNDDEKRG